MKKTKKPSVLSKRAREILERTRRARAAIDKFIGKTKP